MSRVFTLSPNARTWRATLSMESSDNLRIEQSFHEQLLLEAESLRQQGYSEETIDHTIRFSIAWAAKLAPSVILPPEPEFFDDELTTAHVEFP